MSLLRIESLTLGLALLCLGINPLSSTANQIDKSINEAAGHRNVDLKLAVNKPFDFRLGYSKTALRLKQTWQHGMQIGFLMYKAPISQGESDPALCAMQNDMNGFKFGYMGQGYFGDRIGIRTECSFALIKGDGARSFESPDPLINELEDSKFTRTADLNVGCLNAQIEALFRIQKGFSISVGPSFDYVTSAKEKEIITYAYSSDQPEVLTESQKINKRKEINSCGIGSNIGLHYQMDNGLGVSLDYYNGFLDLMPNIKGTLTGVGLKLHYSFKNPYQKEKTRIF